jgi:hypothetical protein
VVYALVQHLADLGARAEGRHRRTVLRLEHDLGLPDQVQVMVADLLAAGGADQADAVTEALEAVTRVNRLI